MNLSTALYLILAVGSTAATAAATTTQSNNNDKEEIIRNLLDIPYDSSEYSDIVSEGEYASLVSSRIETTNYWTSERLSTVQPYDRTIDDDNSEEYDEDNDTWFKKRRNNNNNNSNNNNKNLRNNNNNKQHNKRKKKNKQNNRNLQAIVDEGPWDRGGDIKDAAGRLMFTHGTNNYLCSATSVTNTATGRSLIITAAHCVYDDAAKKFADRFMFIPHQDDGGSDRSDYNCDNDSEWGCWIPAFAVVDKGWSDRSWPNNIPWDYAYLVVSDVASHLPTNPNWAMDSALPALDITFQPPQTGSRATALGYSGSKDPSFRHCVQRLDRSASSRRGYLLDDCELTGGSSGGPWCQTGPNNQGRCEIFAVNSYGPSRRWFWDPYYMGGPQLHDNSAECLYEFAMRVPISQAGRGVVVDYNSNNCLASSYTNSNGATRTLPSGTPNPTPAPTPNPTPAPTPNPTPAPSKAPSSSPSKGPSKAPSSSPTSTPTSTPTVTKASGGDGLPTGSPRTSSPSKSPTSPTPEPSVSPSKTPTSSPSSSPSKAPTNEPTPQPTPVVTPSPTPDPGCTGFSRFFFVLAGLC